MSNIAFAPAATTVTGVSANSRRSAEISKLFSAPRWTPPIPPVANTEMPAKFAAIIVAATVVAPVFFCAIQSAKSARDNLAAFFVCAKCVRSVALKPIFKTPSITAIVAGVAPASRTHDSTEFAISRFCGQGIPWVMMVLSNATMGVFFVKASATLGAI